MNKILIFLLISGIILAFSIITLSSAPVINKNVDSIGWVLTNCKFISDLEEKSDSLDEKYQLNRAKTLCERRKAMYSLEYASFIFDIISGFFCTFLSFLQYFEIGKKFKKNTGLIGLIIGIIGFILTFIYFVYSGYIFINDSSRVEKLFPNGAKYKIIDNNSINSKITAYEGDKKDDSRYAKYKDLGQKQYNYDSDYYKIYHKGGESYECLDTNYDSAISPNCNYVYPSPKLDNKNKYLYDKWTTTLIFSFLISICDIGLLIFGLLLFKEGDDTK